MDLVVELPLASARASSSSSNGVASRPSSTSRYLALAKIGGGSFGDILAAVNEADPNDWVALKVEACYKACDSERRRAEPSMVRFEQLVCRELVRGPCPGGSRGSAHCCPCAPVRGCTSLHGEQEVLAMELLGPNLREYATALGRWPLPQDLVLVIGAALVERLAQLHACGFVHRDLKPENFLLRLEPAPDEGLVPCFLIVDFAMAMRFASPNGGSHVQRREDAQVEGTHRYMAIHAQRGVTQSRCSDLESLAYVLIYLALGQLPWQNQQDVAKMLEQKESLSVSELCHGLRPQFSTFLETCRKLGFGDVPNYEALQRLLLHGVQGPFDFEADRVRRAFRKELQEAYFRREAVHCLFAACTPVGEPTQASRATLPSALPIFARHDLRTDSTELVASEPSCAADLDDRQGFFFEGYGEPLPGTVHVVVGARHFFGFFKLEYLTAAHKEAGLASTGAEQLLVFSLGRRDWVVRAVMLRDYDATSGKTYKEWNLRCAFWARVVLPWPAA